MSQCVQDWVPEPMQTHIQPGAGVPRQVQVFPALQVSIACIGKIDYRNITITLILWYLLSGCVLGDFSSDVQ